MIGSSFHQIVSFSRFHCAFNPIFQSNWANAKVIVVPFPAYPTVCTEHEKSSPVWVTKVCLCWGLTSQSAIFQSCRDGATASWVINQYFRGVKCLAQGHNTVAVGLEPPTSRSGVRHSTTEPPRSPGVTKVKIEILQSSQYFNHAELSPPTLWDFYPTRDVVP